MADDRVKQVRTKAPQYRRTRGLVAYWESSGLVCFDCISGRRLSVVPGVLRFLHRLDDWTTARELSARLGEDRDMIDVSASLRSLARMGLVERRSGKPEWPWGPWMPEAAFFHFGTRGGPYPDDPRDQDVLLRAKAAHAPPPAPTKSITGQRIELPRPQPVGGLSDVLKARRTWRNFSAESVPIDALATLLQLTWGVQHRGIVEGQGAVVLKTSPSGGARHPIEAYVLASNVQGLAARAYHYDAATHELVDLRRAVSAAIIERLLGNQDYYRGAAAVVVMTAVIARSMWKYPRSRAYRTILADAGHLGQTFCLLATAAGLAPFCTMAFREKEIEQLLHITGVDECAMYIVGVGARANEHLARPGRIHPKNSDSHRGNEVR
jgi:SagB-type dehydrogenase family enzyme